LLTTFIGLNISLSVNPCQAYFEGAPTYNGKYRPTDFVQARQDAIDTYSHVSFSDLQTHWVISIEENWNLYLQQRSVVQECIAGFCL
jgi:hypothetical protein